MSPSVDEQVAQAALNDSKGDRPCDTPASNVPALTTRRTTATIYTFLEDAKSWLRDCAHDHRLCDVGAVPRSSLRNLRVIDCYATRVVNKRLTVIDAPVDCVYMALSYVWGADKRSSSLGDCLPQTIEDSITTVLLVGCNYLWVDKYVTAAECLHMAVDLCSVSSRTLKIRTIRYSRWARYILGHMQLS